MDGPKPDITVAGGVGVPGTVGGAERSDVGSGEAVELTDATGVVDGAVALIIFPRFKASKVI